MKKIRKNYTINFKNTNAYHITMLPDGFLFQGWKDKFYWGLKIKNVVYMAVYKNS